MNTEQIELLRKLCTTSALSGHEDPMIRIMREQMSRYTKNIRVDGIGNVIAMLPAAHPGAPTLLIAAHMDELGFVVRKVESDGFIRVNRLGGIPERVLAGQPVALQTDGGGSRMGVIGLKSHHITPAEEKYVVVPVDKVYVDSSFTSAAAAHESGVHVGTPITYRSFFEIVGDQIMSKSLDDRLGCYALLQVLSTLQGKPLPVNVAFVATVHEEFSGRGSVVAATSVKPDMAIALDLGASLDTPDLKGGDDIRLRGGTAITSYTFHPRGPLVGTLANPKLHAQMIATANRHGLPYQESVMFGGLTDVSYMQYEGDGIPVLEISIPARYTHSPIEVSAIGDVENTIALLAAFVQELPTPFDLSRG